MDHDFLWVLDFSNHGCGFRKETVPSKFPSQAYGVKSLTSLTWSSCVFSKTQSKRETFFFFLDCLFLCLTFGITTENGSLR